MRQLVGRIDRPVDAADTDMKHESVRRNKTDTTVNARQREWAYKECVDELLKQDQRLLSWVPSTNTLSFFSSSSSNMRSH